jgi:hypothetical protein
VNGSDGTGELASLGSQNRNAGIVISGRISKFLPCRRAASAKRNESKVFVGCLRLKILLNFSSRKSKWWIL